MRWTSRAGGLATLVSCALGACSDPELASALNPDGPPEVTEVNVRSETEVLADGLLAGETATYCRSGEQYKVNLSYCPLVRDGANTPIPGMRDVEDEVMDADPRTWYVRVVVDELLDASIEEMADDGTAHIKDTDPFTLTCNGAPIAYDGWYDSGGNALGFPPGPGLVATFQTFVATGSPCTIEIHDNVVDKDGNAVPADQRGPYSFDVAPLRVYSINPADDATGIAVNAKITVDFNAPIDIATAETRIVVTDADGNVVGGQLEYHMTEPTSPDDVAEIDDKAVLVFTPAAPLALAATYMVTVNPAITDLAGGPLGETAQEDEPRTSTFTVVPATP